MFLYGGIFDICLWIKDWRKNNILLEGKNMKIFRSKSISLYTFYLTLVSTIMAVHLRQLICLINRLYRFVLPPDFRQLLLFLR